MRLVRRKEWCIILDWIAHYYTLEHCGVYYDVLTAEQFTRYQNSFVVVGTEVRLSTIFSILYARRKHIAEYKDLHYYGRPSLFVP